MVLFLLEWRNEHWGLVIATALFLVSFFLLLWMFTDPFKETSTSTLQVKSCPNPNCIRCQRYREIQSNAQRRLPWVTQQVQQRYPQDSLDRLIDSIRNPQRHHVRVDRGNLQAPNVLMIRDLPTRAVVTELHTLLSKFFEQQGSDLVERILAEIDMVPYESWNRNDTDNGTWEILPLLNQGEWTRDFGDFPQLSELVQSIPGFLKDCLFGNAMISRIYSGTRIEPHCGPSNVRHRLQYVLQIPESTSSYSSRPILRVGNHSLFWDHPGSFFVFDDSIVHAVEFEEKELPLPSAKGPHHRTVLIVDLWHPQLTDAERAMICYMYPAVIHSKESHFSSTG